jgi:PmbA protein
MLSQQEAGNLCQQVLDLCGNNETEVLLFEEDNALTRFANNAIHQNVSERNLNVHLRLYQKNSIGMASTNRTDKSALEELVARATANAKASPEDPDDPGLGGPFEYSSLMPVDQTTVEYSAEQRAKDISVVCRLADEKDLKASGAFSTGASTVALANSRGTFAYQTSTQADFQTVVMNSESSGWSQATSWRVSEVPVESLGREAIAKAEGGINPRKIPPGKYAVIFDPYVTQDLLYMLDVYGMSAQAVQEGRSWMNDRIGEKVVSSKVSIYDDGLNPDGLPMAFDFEGVPKKRVDIIDQGMVRGPVHDRTTAKRGGTESSGHAIPPFLRTFGPLALNLFMTPGKASLEEMIKSTQHGVYITRFWYTRLVHPSDCVITGMTRDGVFMIENGEIAYPVKNLRFTQSYIQALAEVEAVGAETRLLYSRYVKIASLVPALKIASFNFTASTV